MKVNEFEGKNLDETIESALNELNITKDEAIIKDEEIKGSILKKTTYKVIVYKYTDIIEYITNYLKQIISLMGLEVQFETKIRESQLYVKMYTNNNALVIGKEGKNLQALTLIVKQMLSSKYDINPKIILDVDTFRDKKEKRIERMAKSIAKEVLHTKIDVKLSNMNSYERRIVHNTLSDWDKITTISEGEEPNRHVIVKYKKDDNSAE